MDSCHCESAQGEKSPLACLANTEEAELVLLIAPRTPLGDPEATGGIQAGAADLNSHLSSDSKWGQKVPLNSWGKQSPGKGVMVPFC